MIKSSYIERFKKNVKRYYFDDLLNDYTVKQLDDAMNYYLKNHRVTDEKFSATEFYNWLVVPFTQDLLYKLHIIDKVHYVGF